MLNSDPYPLLKVLLGGSKVGNKVLNQRLVKIWMQQARSKNMNTVGAAVSSGSCIYVHNFIYARTVSLCVFIML